MAIDTRTDAPTTDQHGDADVAQIATLFADRTRARVLIALVDGRASAQVATILEALAAIAPAQPVRSLREGTRAAALRRGRTCYDHLAGRLGVAVTQALLDRGALAAADGTTSTQRRPADALSAPLGAEAASQVVALLRPIQLSALTAANWLTRRPQQRAVRLTDVGAHALHARLGITLD